MPVNCVAYQSNKSINKSRIDGINYRPVISPTETRQQLKQLHVSIAYELRSKLEMQYKCMQLYLCVVRG